jgi:hypothetical protein
MPDLNNRPMPEPPKPNESGVVITTHTGDEFLPGEDVAIGIYGDGTIDVTQGGEIIFVAAQGEWRRARRHKG